GPGRINHVNIPGRTRGHRRGGRPRPEGHVMGLNSGALIKRLNRTCHSALEGAAGLCVSRTNRSVEVEHWLQKLAEAEDTDLTRIFRHFEVDPARVQADLTRAIDRFKTGHDRTPVFSTGL